MFCDVGLLGPMMGSVALSCPNVCPSGQCCLMLGCLGPTMVVLGLCWPVLGLFWTGLGFVGLS